MDNLDKVKILEMTYDNVEVMAPNVVTYVEEGIRYVTTLDGDVIIKEEDNKTQVLGEFITIKLKNDTLEIHNLSTLKKLKCSRVYDIKSIGGAFLVLYYTYGDTNIIDRNLDVTAVLKNYCRIHIYKETEVGCYFSLRNDYTIDSNGVAYANKLTGKIESFGSFELDSEFGCIAVETIMNPAHRISLNINSDEYFKYKLARHGIIIGEKAYADIIKSNELSGTDLLYSIECNPNVRKEALYGIINKQGKEIIKPEFNSIKHIGNYKFILESNKKYLLYDLLSMSVIFDYAYIADVIHHSTLPLTLIKLVNNQFYIADYKGDVYTLDKFTEHFECYYSNSCSNILKVIINEFNTKYITDRFIPITNIKEVSRLMNESWVRI